MTGAVKPRNGRFGPDYQPENRRHKSFKTLLLQTLKEQALVECGEDATRDEMELAFIGSIARRAYDLKDPSSGMLLKEMLVRAYPALKPTMPLIEFEFDRSGSVGEQVAQILQAASSNQVPPDVANIFVQTLKAAIDIEAATDLKARIEHLESVLNDRA